MQRITLTILLLSLFVSCKTESPSLQKIEYSREIGDITNDSLIDDPSFKPCNGDEKISQYYYKEKSFGYKGEKHALVKVFKDKFELAKKDGENGWIRIRFIINCEGETGRFRIIESDYNYKPFKFSSEIKKRLLEITKNLDGWEPGIHEDHTHDYYQYLIFKIENGQLIEILP